MYDELKAACPDCGSTHAVKVRLSRAEDQTCPECHSGFVARLTISSHPWLHCLIQCMDCLWEIDRRSTAGPESEIPPPDVPREEASDSDSLDELDALIASNTDAFMRTIVEKDRKEALLELDRRRAQREAKRKEYEGKLGEREMVEFLNEAFPDLPPLP